MRKFFYTLLIFILFISTQSHPIIIKSNNLEEIYKHLKKDPKKPRKTLILFDIDDTIANLPFGLGQWLNYKISKLLKEGYSQKEALNLTLPTWFLIVNNTELSALNSSPEIIKDLQKKKFAVMGLTNRSMPIIKKTVKQLKKIKINFKKRSLYKKNLDISITHKGKLSKGILFTGKNDKGQSLFLLLEKLNYKPKKIIFIDDQLKQIKSVEKEAKKHGIEYVGIHICSEDRNKKPTPDFIKEKFYEFKINLGIEPLI